MSTAASRMSKGKGKGRAVVEEEAEAMVPLGKQLAHTDKKVRDRAIQSLVGFLSAGGSTLEAKEMTKLWKGLFYCYWMSDKPLVQQALATDLSELLLRISPPQDHSSEEDFEARRLDAALAFLRGFWEAMVREWAGIDRLRIDKFYALLRKYVNATFRLLARERWSEDALSRVNEILGGGRGPLSWRDPSVPTALANHLADIYLEELDKVLALPEVTSQPSCPLTFVLQPHITLLAHTPVPNVHKRLMTALFQPLISALNHASPSTSLATSDPADGPSRKRQKRETQEPVFAHVIMHSTADPKGEDERSSPQRLKAGLLKAMFNAASAEKAVEANRRRIYLVYREEGGDDDDDEEED